MHIREIKATLEGNVLETSVRTLSEREMAGVSGGSPIFLDHDEDYGTTPSCCVIEGCCCYDDCHD